MSRSNLPRRIIFRSHFRLIEHIFTQRQPILRRIAHKQLTHEQRLHTFVGVFLEIPFLFGLCVISLRLFGFYNRGFYFWVEMTLRPFSSGTRHLVNYFDSLSGVYGSWWSYGPYRYFLRAWTPLTKGTEFCGRTRLVTKNIIHLWLLILPLSCSLRITLRIKHLFPWRPSSRLRPLYLSLRIMWITHIPRRFRLFRCFWYLLKWIICHKVVILDYIIHKFGPISLIFISSLLLSFYHDLSHYVFVNLRNHRINIILL